MSETSWITFLIMLFLVAAYLASRRDIKRTPAANPTPEDEDKKKDEEAFSAFYQERTRKSRIMLKEEQARRLYEAFKKNQDIIEKQRTHEVER